MPQNNLKKKSQINRNSHIKWELSIKLVSSLIQKRELCNWNSELSNSIYELSNTTYPN